MTKQEFMTAIEALDLDWSRNVRGQYGELRCARGDCPIIALARSTFSVQKMLEIAGYDDEDECEGIGTDPDGQLSGYEANQQYDTFARHLDLDHDLVETIVVNADAPFFEPSEEHLQPHSGRTDKRVVWQGSEGLRTHLLRACHVTGSGDRS